MVLVKILKRKDASSLIVGIVLAGIISGLLTMTLIQPAFEIAGTNDFGQGAAGWKNQYLQPVVFALFQVIALEVLAWITIGILALFKKK